MITLFIHVNETGDVVIFYFFFFGVLCSIFALQMHLSLLYIKDLKKPFFTYSGLLDVRNLLDLRLLPTSLIIENPGYSSINFIFLSHLSFLYI